MTPDLTPWPCTKSACTEPADPSDPDGFCPEHADDNAREWDRITNRIAREARA